MAEASAWVMIPKSDKKATEIVIDMRPLVLCKDCKHRPKKLNLETYETGFDLEFPEGSKCPCRCGGNSWYPENNWFCADGERRDAD